MKKKRKIKFELVFCAISFVFILLILLFFGFKIFVNSKKYNDNIISSVVSKNKTISKAYLKEKMLIIILNFLICYLG